MAVERKRRHSGCQLALVFTWLAYAIVQCPNCPGAETRLVRCALGGQAVAAPPAAESRDCHGTPAPEDHRHSPGGDCCESVESRTGTATARVFVDSPVVTVLPWMFAALTVQPHGQLHAGSAPLAPLANSPPRFLLLQSLLI